MSTMLLTGAGLGSGSSPFLTGLVSYWKLDEASGTRSDSHGSNHLTDNNTVGSAAGRIGNAALFIPANSEWLSRASNASLQAGDIDFTFSLWIYKTSFPGNREAISKLGGSTNEYMVYFDATAIARFQVGAGAAVSGTTLTTDGWHHVLAWYDAAADLINIQVDGGVVNTAAHSGGCTPGNSTFGIASRNGVTNLFDGLIDEVGYWKRVLTAGERAQLYNSGMGVTYPTFA